MNTLDQPSVTFRPAAFLSGAPGVWVGHLPFACDLIAALRPEVIVELGVGYGDSYFGFCQTVAETKLPCTCYGIDSWRSDSAGNYYETSAYEAASRHNDRYYRSFSYLVRATFEEAIKRFSDASVGLLHMDGSRSYEAARGDFDQWIGKAQPGGVVLLDRIAVRTGDSGVWRLWEELQEKYKTFEFRHSDGLGVLWKPGGNNGQNPYLQELFSSSKENQEKIRRYYCLCAERLEMEHTLWLSRASDAGHSLVQVAVAQNGRYQADEGLGQIIGPGKWTNVFLRLPHGQGERGPRLDVGSRTGIVDIESIQARKAGGRTIWSWTPDQAADGFRVEGTAYRMPSEDSFRILSFGNAPQIYLPPMPGIDAGDPLELELRLKLDVELTAVQDVARRATELERERTDWEQQRRREQAQLETAKQETSRFSDKDRAKLAAQYAEREQALLKQHEAAKQTLAKAHEEKTRRLSQQLEQSKESASRISEETRAALSKQHEEAKSVIVEQFEKTRQELERRLAIAEEQLEQQRKAQLAAADEKDRMQQGQALLAQRVSIAQGNVDELKTEIERLSLNHAEVQRDLLDARKTNSRMAAALDLERSARAEIENSRSWQMMKPLRNMLGLFSRSAPR